MKIRVHVTDARNEPWAEDYDLPDSTNPEEWADRTVKEFNATLRPYEKAREILRVERLPSEHVNHNWEKVSVMTQSGPRGMYDRMRCRGCGITGKRCGLGQAGVKRDSKFRQYVFEHCDTALALLEKRKRS